MSRLHLRLALGLPLVVSCTSTSYSSTTPTGPDYGPTVQAVSDEAILPAAARFETSSQDLDAAIAALCEEPDEDLVEGARTSWRQASHDWNRFVLYDFGPLAEGITPLDAYIDSFKAFGQGKSYVESLRGELVDLVSSGTDLSGEDLSSWTFQRVGLVAIEVALFETTTDPHDPSASAVADELGASPEKCTYLVKQTELLAERATELHLAWLPEGGDYRAQFLSSTDDALAAVITSVHGHLEYIDKRSMATQGAPVSGASFDQIGASIDEVEHLLDAGGGASLRARLEGASASDVVTEHEAGVAAARAAIEAEDAEGLSPELIGLAAVYKQGIPDALGLELGLNFTDGD